MSLPERLIAMMQSSCVECGCDFDPTDPPDGDHECRTLITPADLHWVICSRCRGDGALRGYPGVYTQDDFASGDVDLDDYLEHRRTCDDCDGTGKRRELSEEAEARPEVQEWIRDYYDTEHIYAMERRMGA
jgi:hypothetical protein